MQSNKYLDGQQLLSMISGSERKLALEKLDEIIFQCKSFKLQ